MNVLYLISDQLLAWSVYFDRQVCSRFTRTPREAHQTASTATQYSARLTHRALQALRQSQLPLRAGPWTWPQVLPLRQLPWRAATNGLRPRGVPRADQRLTVRLSTRAGDPGRSLRDQPGAPASSRDTLSEWGERDRSAHRFCRFPHNTRSTSVRRGAGLVGRPVRQRADRQYVSCMDRCTGFVLHRRGEHS